ncbi:uncharacterized protein V1518DRAFT_409380 [Limtongia smithiae]|uniref:uncharacterized protein n=1 Tax=Limtongia smithiae TaxID=1125753 RepID=UPI0034CD348D
MSAAGQRVESPVAPGSPPATQQRASPPKRPLVPESWDDDFSLAPPADTSDTSLAIPSGIAMSQEAIRTHLRNIRSFAADAAELKQYLQLLCLGQNTEHSLPSGILDEAQAIIELAESGDRDLDVTRPEDSLEPLTMRVVSHSGNDSDDDAAWDFDNDDLTVSGVREQQPSIYPLTPTQQRVKLDFSAEALPALLARTTVLKAQFLECITSRKIIVPVL